MAAKAAGWGGETLKMVLCVVVMPLVLLAWGAWQSTRLPSQADMQQEIAQVEADIARLSPMAGDFSARVELEDGKTVSAAQALVSLRAYQETLSGSDIFGRELPRGLNRVGLPLAVLAALAGVLGLIYIRILGQQARRSREALLRSFNLARRLLPWLLGCFAIGVFGALVCMLGFELSRFVAHGISGRGSAKLVMLGVILMLGFLGVAVRSLYNLLRAARAAFTPEPITVMGRTLSRTEAPGLWAYVEGIATDLNARKPDAIVVGMDEGFFVTEVAVQLASGEAIAGGRVLYLPLPYMAYLDRSEVAAIIGHELGHFTGDDTRYSLEFGPIYASATNSLQAVFVSASNADLQAYNPVLLLGEFFLRAFHEAVQHWSRQRELAADQFGARGAGPQAAASALLRTCALAPRVQQALAECWEAGNGNVLARTRELVAQLGMEDPGLRLDYSQPHPTDSHPPLGQRLGALGVATPSAELLARAREAAGSTLLAELGLESSPSVAQVVAQTTLAAGAATASTGASMASAAAAPQSLAGSLEAEFSQAAKNQRMERITVLRALAANGQTPFEVRERYFLQIALASLIGGILFLFGLLKPAAEGGSSLTTAWMILGGLGLLVFAAYHVYRRRHVSLTLNAQGIQFKGGSDTLPWTLIADYGIQAINSTLIVTLSLVEAKQPAVQMLGAPAKYGKRHHTVTFRLSGVKGLSDQAFADRLRESWLGGLARAELAEMGEYQAT